MKKKLNNILRQLHTPGWLFFILITTLLVRVPSFFEPYSYGDEMIYLTLGEAIRRGIPLYKGIHDNKPPLLYIIAAIAGNLFWFKAILTIWMLTTIYIFWKLTEKLFPDNILGQKIAVVIFAVLTTIPLLEGNIVNAELFMIGPSILAFLMLISKNLNKKKVFIAGGLFSTAVLFKVPAIFDAPAIVFLWLAQAKINVKNIKTILKNTSLLILGISTPILITVIWFLTQGSLREYITAAFLQNIGYLSSWRPVAYEKSFLVRNFPLLIRAGIVLLGLVIVYVRKSKLSKPFILASSWLLLSLFAVTLSERPYPHYLIQSVPPIAILLSILVSYKTIEQVLTIIPLTLAVFVPFYYHFWHYKTLPYYTRFINFATKKISVQDYLSSFGSQVPRDYKIADFLSKASSKNDKVFVWGEGSPIYALSKRLPPGVYVSDYHIKDFSTEKEMLSVLYSDMPAYIVITGDLNEFPSLEPFLSTNYAIVQTIDSVNIWKLLTPKVRSLMSYCYNR